MDEELVTCICDGADEVKSGLRHRLDVLRSRWLKWNQHIRVNQEPCPPPSDTVVEVIGPEGGSVSHPEGAVLHVPPGALAEPTSLSIATAAAPSAGALRATSLGRAFVLGPEGQSFALPVELTLPFEPASVPAGTSRRVHIAQRGSPGLKLTAQTHFRRRP